MLSNEERKIFRQKALMNNGYYDRNGNWNAIKVINGNIYRDRVETLIIKDKEFVFIKLSGEKGKYKLPGGSLGKDITPETQAINECHEETHFEVSNIQSTGITYKVNYPDNNKTKDNEYQYGVKYIGAFTSLFTAEYAGTYNGKIAEADEDPYVRSGKWYTFKEAFGIFNQWHRDALLQYIKLNLPSEEYTTEGYFLNRVKNSVLLKSKNIQEIDINVSNYMVSQIVMKYNKLRFTSGNKKVTVGFYRVPLKSGGSFEVGIVIDFGGDKVGNPAYAYKTVGGDDAITFNPAFFKASKDDQLFTLLHELGHIRLKHTDPNNYKRAFGRRYDPYVTRGNDIKRGGVSYVELNADTYSVLNGGKAYTLLNPDHGDDEDSKLNNLELARRFDIATRRKDAFERRYGTIESAEDELTTESYFTNWFSNEFKLWSKEIRTDTPQDCLEHTLMLLDKAYLKHKNDKKYLNGKIYSFATTTGPNFKKDGKYTTDLISYCINFTDKNNGPAYAMVSDDGENLVVVTPEYFTMSKETKKYVLLHEIGHIRLDHLNPKNIPVDLFGNPVFDKLRTENILSGKTMYTELNADLYAILNGAKLYTILDVAHKQDFDSEKNPFIYSNYEIADRFKKATERALRRDLFKGLPNIG
nr:MAG TPA: IrrE protein [Caudoviricetes sp.]